MNNCEKRIGSFNYPYDIELLEKEKYICGENIFDKFKIAERTDDLKMEKGFKLLFSDANYTLVEYDLITRLLYDKKNDLFLVFKASVPYSFYQKDKDGNLRGMFNIYFLDNQLLPLFSFNKVSGVKKFRINHNKKISEYIKVKLNNEDLSLDINKMNYTQILNIIDELKKENYSVSGVWKENYCYVNPPEWTIL